MFKDHSKTKVFEIKKPTDASYTFRINSDYRIIDVINPDHDVPYSLYQLISLSTDDLIFNPAIAAECKRQMRMTFETGAPSEVNVLLHLPDDQEGKWRNLTFEKQHDEIIVHSTVLEMPGKREKKTVAKYIINNKCQIESVFFSDLPDIGRYVKGTPEMVISDPKEAKIVRNMIIETILTGETNLWVGDIKLPETGESFFRSWEITNPTNSHQAILTVSKIGAL